VAGAVPDHGREIRREFVEQRAAHLAVEVVVIAPGDEDAIVGIVRRQRRFEPRPIGVGFADLVGEAARRVPGLNGDHYGRHGEPCENRMHVLLDEACDDHFVGEGLVDAKRLVAGQRLEFSAGADGGDAVAHDRHRFGPRQHGVHRDDLTCDVDRRLGKRRHSAREILQALSLSPSPTRKRERGR
jgi:hypothetical protein